MIKFVETHFEPTKQDKQILYRMSNIYEQVEKDGGFIHLMSQRQLPSYLDQESRTMFHKYLLAYSLNQVLDGSCLKRAHFMTDNEVIEMFTANTSKEWLKHQISVWSLTPYLLSTLNLHYFTFQNLKQNHPNQQIDIRKQVPDYDSFDVAKHNKQVEGWTIKEYIDYIQERRPIKQVQNNQILFAVNVDMEGWSKEINHINQFLPKSLRPQGFDDGLSYLRQEILGVNVPQIYIKKKGVWTGGHQENISVNAININHGPNDCVWITIDAQDIPKLVTITDIDIFKNEGLWFKEVPYFLEKGINIKQTIQKTGDIIILGAGCLHWVKSLGDTINSAWNYLCLNKFTLQQLKIRHEINQQINYRTVIPYKSLLLDIYIHEKQFDHNFIQEIQIQLCHFFQEETTKYIEFKALKLKTVNNCKQVQLCSKCGHEIFIYFYHLDESYFCLNCIPKDCQGPLIAKYNYATLRYLLEQQPTECHQDYCSLYTGNTKCTIQKQLREKQAGNDINDPPTTIIKKNKLNSMLHGGENLTDIKSPKKRGRPKHIDQVNKKNKLSQN